ncbi:hypothetical protein FSP39_012018, partial [Pinctada imbricata]
SEIYCRGQLLDTVQRSRLFPDSKTFVDMSLRKSPDQKPELYSNIASATETGMGFSSRWFSREDGSLNLNTTITKQIIPVDLNSILCEKTKAAIYAEKFRQRKILMENVFWNSKRGIWQDFSLAKNASRDYFFPSNIFPLFADCVDDKQHKMQPVLKYLETYGILDFNGGVPASLINTGEQWDFPNGWPPIQHVFIQTLTRSSNPNARMTGLRLAQKWLWSNYQSWNRSRVIFEKVIIRFTPSFFAM